MLEAVWAVFWWILFAVAGMLCGAVYLRWVQGGAGRLPREEVWPETKEFEEDMEEILARMPDRDPESGAGDGR